MTISTAYSLAKFSRPRPADILVDTVVLHATAGPTFKGAYAALLSAELSYHYIVEDGRETDGLVRKLVPYTRMAFHAGSSYGPHEAARGISREQYRYNALNRSLGRVGKFVAGTSVNAYTVGISLVNRNDGLDPYSDRQAESVVRLLHVLKHVLPLRYVSTHAIVSPGRKTDPRGFPLLAVCADAGLTPWLG